MANASLLSLGVSGLRAHQAALSTTGHNINNVNTEGYTRQRAELSSQQGNFSGAGFSGNGVRVENIARLTNDLLTTRVRNDASAAGYSEALIGQIGQLDTLLADERTGLLPGIEGLFNALNTAADDPSSLPARRLVLAEADGLVARFQTLDQQLSAQGEGASAALTSAADSVSALANDIAQINQAIQTAVGRGNGSQPNDLLDKRDSLLEELGQHIDVTVVAQNGGAINDNGADQRSRQQQINVFIGNGQALVMHDRASRLVVDDRTGNVFLQGGTAQLDVTDALKGGAIGGLLAFRDDALGGAQASLGILALTIADSVNRQHGAGIDLAGRPGGTVFGGLNDGVSEQERALRIAGTGTAEVSVAISDVAALTGDRYELRFDTTIAGAYTVTRFPVLGAINGANAATVVARGAVTGEPGQTISIDGMDIQLNDDAVNRFRPGDQFRIDAAGGAAGSITRSIAAPEELALAAPVRTSRSIGNQGTGDISLGRVLLDPLTAADSVDGVGAGRAFDNIPPLLIEFTSETTYNVLDHSDFGRPKPLTPPLEGLGFIPGTNNPLLPSEPGTTVVVSDGANAGRLGPLMETSTGAVPGANGYLGETMLVTTLDPVSGTALSTQSVSAPANSSARVLAQTLNSVTGVAASAQTELKIVAVSDNQSGVPAKLIVNGIEVASNAENPAPLSVDELADRITANDELKGLGIVARSDGDTLVLTSLFGDDLNVHLAGDNSDTLLLEDTAGEQLLLRGQGAGEPATIVGSANLSTGFNFSSGGPYQFDLAIDGGLPTRVTLTGNLTDAGDLRQGVQQAIDDAVGPNRVIANLDGNGRLTLTAQSSGSLSTLSISGISSISPIGDIGLENTAAAGADAFSTATVGGRVTALLAPGLELATESGTAAGNVFRGQPEATEVFFGVQADLSGRPQAGDRFTIEENPDGAADNRNGLALADLSVRRVVSGGLATYNESYGDLLERVATRTAQARREQDATQGLLEQSKAEKSALSGVNLDEEAANLLRFEQGYNASTRVISVARTLFDELLSVF